MQTMRGGRWICVVALGLGTLRGVAAEPPPVPFGWRQDETYVYRVAIVAQEKDYVASARGHAVYLVRAANPHGFTLRCHNFLSVQRHTAAGRLFPPFGIFRVGWRHFDGGDVGLKLHAPTDVVVNRQGHWLAVSGTPHPIRDLADPATLVLESLPAAPTAAWAVTNTVQVTLESTLKEDEGSRLVKLEKTVVPGEERVSYTIESSTTNTITLHKQYSLTARGKDGGKLGLNGTGNLVFDRARGVFQKLTFTGELTQEQKEHNGTAAPATRIEITYDLLQGAAQANALRPRPPASRIERRPLPPGELDQVLADLRRLMSFPRLRAADILARTEPKERRDEVIAALLPVLKDSDPYTRQAACRALATWGDATAVPALMERLEDQQLTVRWAAIDALAILKDARAAEPLAKLLAAGREVVPAAFALEQIGVAAEPSMLALLKQPRPEARQTACSLLATSGTMRSVLPLMAAARDAHPATAASAKRALREIFQRQGQ